ncbi:hypothetical protein [Deinococcus hopiensis]|uniref:ATP-dependent Clp protease adaptor protein ClpS n=1 Tax=Deinococcus hopiensis KR-140 TaxID=695939 RepID=A0A1W1UEX7_9DEIO|nr:hypothetical protein [Deinococcus hopiensis]SMB79361.1 hypothetical protein SAMN00790413_05899 [Deinococcus hopiensis KR-140]
MAGTQAENERVLLNVRIASGEQITPEIMSKIVTFLMRQPGVVRAHGSGTANLELEYNSKVVTLVELTRALSPAGVRLGIV